MAFEKLKLRYLRRLKKKSVISELNGRKIYLSKGSFLSWIPILGKKMEEWSQIYPAVDEETMKINWINLVVGGKRNLMKLLIVFGIAGMVFMQLDELFRVLEQAVECCDRCNAINLFP